MQLTRRSVNVKQTLTRASLLALATFINVSLLTMLLLIAQPCAAIAQRADSQEDLLAKLLSQQTRRAKTIAGISPEIRALIKREWDSMPRHEKTEIFESYLASRYFWKMEELDRAKGIAPPETGDIIDNGICSDGGCEEGRMDTSVWRGFYTQGGWIGKLDDASIGTLPITGWTSATDPGNPALIRNDAGIPIDQDLGSSSTPFNQRCQDPATQSHFSVVGTANDPILGSLLSTTAPVSPNKNSIRIGNICVMVGGERLEKTFVVQAGQSNLSFWYAAVMLDPSTDHADTAVPGFGIHLFANGVNISNLIDMDAGKPGIQNFTIADAANPFFQTFSYPATAYASAAWPIVYRPWTYISVDLSAYVGQTITVMFVNRDCLHGGHFSYAYVDSFCATGENNPTGWAQQNADESKDCGPEGKLCFDYTVPKTINSDTGTELTGTTKITLQLWQNGVPVGAPISSPVFNKDGRYCFTGAQLLAVANGDFDWTAIISHTIPGGTISPTVIGKQGDGVVKGRNNDFKKDCPKDCCGTGRNYVANGSFEEGNQEFKSDFTFSDILTPGDYLVGNSETAAKACKNWDIFGHTNCRDDDKFLIVNGMTNQTTGNSTAWSQTVQVEPSEKEQVYHFCAWFKDLKQCCFNKEPKITLRASTKAGNVSTETETISAPADRCGWQLVSTDITVPAGVTNVNLEILLDQNADGDGNDVAIDDISFAKSDPVPVGTADFNIATQVLNATTNYNITATPVNTQKPDCKYTWSAAEVDSNGNEILTSKVTWTAAGAFNFAGYKGGTLSAGVFKESVTYRITYRVECDCMIARSESFDIRRNPTALGAPMKGGKKKTAKRPADDFIITKVDPAAQKPE